MVISCQFALGTGWDQRVRLVSLLLLPKVGIVHVVGLLAEIRWAPTKSTVLPNWPANVVGVEGFRSNIQLGCSLWRSKESSLGMLASSFHI